MRPAPVAGTGVGGRLVRPAAPVLRCSAMPPPTPMPSRSERDANAAKRRRLAAVTLAFVVVLFVVQIVALAVGMIEVSWIVLAVLVAGWFVLRSYQKRHPV